MPTQRFKYLILTIICLILGIIIILFGNNTPIIRGFIGDIVVIIFIFSSIKLFFKIQTFKLCLIIFLIAISIELLQLINLLKLLNLTENKIAQIIIGSTFDFKDLLAYLLGTGISFLLAKTINKKRAHKITNSV